MSDIRREFYEAINKANNQKPKKIVKKVKLEEHISIEAQIQNILNESNSAVLNCEVIINNQPLIDWLYELTKKDQETIELEKRINQELEILNKLREEARRKYRLFNSMNEFITFNPSAAASSAAAGAGGRIYITIDNTTNSYVVDGYVEDYLV
jgi:hypothetical protein